MLVDLIGILIPPTATGVLRSAMLSVRTVRASVMVTRAAALRATATVFVRFGSCVIEFCTLIFVLCNQTIKNKKWQFRFLQVLLLIIPGI